MVTASFSSFARKLTKSLFGRKAIKGKSKAATKGPEPRLSQSLENVLARLMEDGHRRILVIGNKAFLSDIEARAPQLAMHWVSCNVADILAGAQNPNEVDFSQYDSAIAGGPDVVASYRIAVTRMGEADAARPVHWVAENWEFCAGTMPVPKDAHDAEAVLFNHFQHFFGVKDSLQFRIDVFCGKEFRRFYRILRPDESLVLRLTDYFPERSETASFHTFVSHPILTRGRHYRLRVCADIFWEQSFTTLHGVHEFNRSPNHKFEFRLPAATYQNSDVVLTLPNYARDMGENDRVETVIDDRQRDAQRPREVFVAETRVNAAEIVGRRYFGWRYAGYGGSNWYSMKPGRGPDGMSAIAANHHSSVPLQPLTNMEGSPEELDEVRRLHAAGYLIDPHPIPVTDNDDPLRYGFNSDGANPAFVDFIVHGYDTGGRLIGEDRYRKAAESPVFVNELPFVAAHPATAMVLLTPDFERIGCRRKGFKTQFELIVQNRQTRDWDVTESQSCWRNIGLIVPGVAHFAGPTGPVLGRTSLVARARSGGGFRTAVLACHASGRLAYRSAGTLKLKVFNARGESIAAEAPVPSFTWRHLWLDELLPNLSAFLAPTGLGPLVATSPDADINCQIVTTSDRGAVSLQHMWGY